MTCFPSMHALTIPATWRQVDIMDFSAESYSGLPSTKYCATSAALTSWLRLRLLPPAELLELASEGDCLSEVVMQIFLEPKAPQTYRLIQTCEVQHVTAMNYLPCMHNWQDASAVQYLHPALTLKLCLRVIICKSLRTGVSPSSCFYWDFFKNQRHWSQWWEICISPYWPLSFGALWIWVFF